MNSVCKNCGQTIIGAVHGSGAQRVHDLNCTPCADPIERGHEAALGEAEERIRLLELTLAEANENERVLNCRILDEKESVENLTFSVTRFQVEANEADAHALTIEHELWVARDKLSRIESAISRTYPD